MVAIHLKTKTSEGMPMVFAGVMFEKLAMIKENMRKQWISLVACAIGLAMLAACAFDMEKNREQADLHINIGTAYIESGDHNGALKELLKAEIYTPRDPRIHYFLALAYMGKGYYEKAIEACKMATTLKEDYSEAHNLLGIIYMDQGRYDLAIESFNNALQNMLYDTPAFALYHLGRAYHQTGDYEKAMAKYQEAVMRDVRGQLLPLIENGMGKTSYARGDISRATAHFQRSTELAPSYVESYFWLGECYMKKGALKEAKMHYEKVIQLAPTSDLSLKAKAYVEKIGI